MYTPVEPRARERLTIVVPIYNEREVFPSLISRLTALMERLSDIHCDTILVNDGSTDGSADLIRNLCARDPRYRGLMLARNFGHQAAVSTGLGHAQGDYIAIIDGDLQDPPEVIEELVATLRAGADVAYAVRQRRKESVGKRLLYALYYRILQRVANVNIPLDSGDFCCMRKRVVAAMQQLPERNRFVRGLRAWVGFKQVGVTYERHARLAGQSHYTTAKLLRLAYDGLFAFSTLPIYLMQALGFVISLLSGLVAAAYFVWYLIDQQKFPSGFATLIISIWLLAGVQLLFLGIIGEYLVRTHDEARRRPVAIVAEAINFESVNA